MLPNYITHPYPRGWQNPIDARPSAVLLATFDAAPVEFSCAGAHALTITFTYTRGAAGGAFDYQIEASPYSGDTFGPAGSGVWANQTAFAVGAVALGADTQSDLQAEYVTYGSQGAAIETAIVGPIILDGTVERLRIPARESADGVPLTPGTLQITVEMI